MEKRIGAGASACAQFGNGEHFVSHSQGTQGFLVQKKNDLQPVPPGLVSCSISKAERGVAAGEMPESLTVFQITLENLMSHYRTKSSSITAMVTIHIRMEL